MLKLTIIISISIRKVVGFSYIDDKENNLPHARHIRLNHLC